MPEDCGRWLARCWTFHLSVSELAKSCHGLCGTVPGVLLVPWDYLFSDNLSCWPQHSTEN